MDLPDGLQRLPFKRWNPLVRDLVVLWDQASQFGCQPAYESFVQSDPDGRAAEFVAAVAESVPLDGGHALFRS